MACFQEWFNEREQVQLLALMEEASLPTFIDLTLEEGEGDSTALLALLEQVETELVAKTEPEEVPVQGPSQLDKPGNSASNNTKAVDLGAPMDIPISNPAGSNVVHDGVSIEIPTLSAAEFELGRERLFCSSQGGLPFNPPADLLTTPGAQTLDSLLSSLSNAPLPLAGGSESSSNPEEFDPFKLYQGRWQLAEFVAGLIQIFQGRSLARDY